MAASLLMRLLADDSPEAERLRRREVRCSRADECTEPCAESELWHGTPTPSPVGVAIISPSPRGVEGMATEERDETDADELAADDVPKK